ncbi:MAG: hypothetical protein OQK09_02895 [Colwellia sp.]|nr:hypothetical protein [Colwellia sp.]MCW8863272.1 hypothetical protein [Colwellia sp.]MCW9080433.1 hypothetical protein [Colwellia sp.]
MIETQQPQTAKPNSSMLSQLQQDIINNFQKGFPLCSRPYLAIAQELSHYHHELNEQAVFTTLKDLDYLGVTSRIGPVFDHKKAGASTLAALAVEPKNLDKIASIVNQFEQVNHNYARGSHFDKTDYNLWFVVTASDPVALNNTLTRIELLTGLAVLVLPMEASYHLDLAFTINITGKNSPIVNTVQAVDTHCESELTEIQKTQLRKLIEAGLPKLLQPYEKIAQAINASEQQVLAQITHWQKTGLIRRFGLVVKNRKLGFNANAMVVWNINDAQVDAIAAKLSKRSEVSLCYRRPRRGPNWPYNLFCMIHGTDKDVVLQQISNITELLGLAQIEKDILFSFKAYKQKGASYFRSKKLQTKSEVAHG